MKKSERVAALLAGASQPETAPDKLALDPFYTGYFRCFNDQLYYEAHDVLEQLWLRERNADWEFFKGLIQIAGAFVHLQKQFLRPLHCKDGRRMFPAVRLFRSGACFLNIYRPVHLRLDVDALCAMCEDFAGAIVASNYTRNPWHPDRAPQISLQDGD